MQFLALTSDEEEDREDEKEEWSAASLARESQSAAYPETWRTLYRTTHKQGPAFAQCRFIPLFSLPVDTSVA